jgi:hypothetical protein
MVTHNSINEMTKISIYEYINPVGLDRRLSAKLVPTFADRGVSRSQRGGSRTVVISVF